LLLYARSARTREELRRRMGELRADANEELIRQAEEEAKQGSLAQLVHESGLGWTMGMFIARLVLAAFFGLLIGILFGSGFLAVAFALTGVVILWVIVRAARARRLAQCDEQMPQALEIMSLALRAGHALPKALSLAADEAPTPLRYELRRAADEHSLGRPIAGVLESLSHRLPGCDAVNTFVVAVLVLQETGGNLIAVIDRIVENARARASYQARLRALTSEGRQSAKLLALLPGAFAVLAILSDPSYGDMLFYDSGGRIITILAATLWVIGIFWTRRLVRPVN
jgi:tight adherence protein B